MIKTTVPIDTFKELDLRVAEILKVEPHPNADRLWMIQIKVGDEERTIVAGIRQHYPAEELIGKKIVVVYNLQPALIRGVESNGMLLAAGDRNKLTLLVPDKEIASGTRIN